MRENPIINTNDYPLKEGTTYGTDEDEFMLGVAAENQETGAYLSDPRYVRWVTALWEKKDDEWIVDWYPMHACSEEEFKRFESPESKQTADKVNRLMAGKHLYCMDWKVQAFQLYGSE